MPDNDTLPDNDTPPELLGPDDQPFLEDLVDRALAARRASFTHSARSRELLILLFSTHPEYVALVRRAREESERAGSGVVTRRSEEALARTLDKEGSSRR